MQALDDVVVLDLTQHIAGPYATKLLADFGADVIKIERPGGEIARTLSPFRGGNPDPEQSGLFFFLNTNKRSVELDLRTPAAKRALAAIAARVDIVIESFKPGTPERLGIDYDFFKAINPALPVVSVSNFGQTGPYRDYLVTELVLYAFAGEMYSMGLTEREPVKMAGTAGLFESGASIAVASMGAFLASKWHGIGQHVDIALAETHFGGVDRRHASTIAYQFSGRKNLRAAGDSTGMPGGIYPCADGWVDFTAAGLRWDRIIDMLNNPEWLQDPRFHDPLQRLNPEVAEVFNVHFLEWCLGLTKREVWAEARRAHVLCAPLFTVEDLFADEHFRDRGFWEEVTHPVMGRVTIPGRPLIMQKGGWAMRRPAPLLGQHTEEVLRESGLDEPTIREILARKVPA